MDVLVAHREVAIRSAVRAALGDDTRVLEAADAQTALALCAEHAPQVALISLTMCREDGLPLLQTIKRDPDLFRTAVVVMAPDSEDAAALDALTHGADDVMRDPPATSEIVGRVRAAARAAALRDQLLERERGLEEMAYNDELTRLYNRRFLGRQLSALIRSSVRHDRALSIVLVDIDRFKAINDSHGHAKGDTVLTRVATRLLRVLREEDYAGRWGGEEFLVLLPDVDEDGAHATAERLRASVAARSIVGLPVTVSAGVATWASGESADDLLRRADDALYSAKRAGRDRVHAAS